jgi:hypothetical protein
MHLKKLVFVKLLGRPCIVFKANIFRKIVKVMKKDLRIKDKIRCPLERLRG